ncbi:unnamed protein product [Urochloa humidicola]
MDARQQAEMEGFKGKAIVMDEVEAGSDERPAKLLCQGAGTVSRTAVVADVCSVDGGAGSSDGMKQSARVPVAVELCSDGGSVFDCSVLKNALKFDLFLPSEVSEHSDDESPADVFVPGTARPAEISKQMIVKEVCHRLHLVIHDFGIIDEADGLLRGWVEMDVPGRLGAEPKMREKFVGADALGQYAAMEIVSAEIIEALCKRFAVIVEDVNYPKVKKLEERLFEEKTWADLFRGQLRGRVKENDALRCAFGNVISEAKIICSKFKDILPIAVSGEEDAAAGVGNAKLVYNGPRDPVTRADELAFDLLSFVKRAVDLQSAVCQGKVEHVPLKRKRYRCRG